MPEPSRPGRPEAPGAEAVRQVRGTSVNQVGGDGPVLVTAGTGVPTSGLILGPA